VTGSLSQVARRAYNPATLAEFCAADRGAFKDLLFETSR
jgi:hypothetical protein